MPNPDSLLLEANISLSQSLIWRRQREFYVQRGLKAWTEDRVPNFITNNPFFAEINACIVLGFFEDCLESGLSAAGPLRILELGAGPGKFGYLFLSHLTALLRAKGLKSEVVNYCMTDCVPALIEQWRGNSYLAQFAQAGILEFEVLDVGGVSQSPFLNRGRGSGPLVLIANYVFDSLPQDAFVIQDGKVREALVSTRFAAQGVDDEQQLSQLELSYKNVEVAPIRYAEPSWNQILDCYRNQLPAASVSFPVQALETLQEVGRMAVGRLLVLAADKGFAHQDALTLQQVPQVLEFHAPNCFSMMVNFDAIGKYFEDIGGEALLPDKHFSSLNLCGFLGPQPGSSFPRTEAAYQESQAAFGADDLFTLLAWLNAHIEEMSVPQILAALRLTRWDPIAFMRMFPTLARQLRNVVAERSDLRLAMLRTWANHYPVSANENEVAFQCGVVLLELRFFDDALAMFRTAQQILGPSAATSYNLGLCLQGLNRLQDALTCMIEACNLDPNFQPARLSRQKLEGSAF